MRVAEKRSQGNGDDDDDDNDYGWASRAWLVTGTHSFLSTKK